MSISSLVDHFQRIDDGSRELVSQTVRQAIEYPNIERLQVCTPSARPHRPRSISEVCRQSMSSQRYATPSPSRCRPRIARMQVSATNPEAWRYSKPERILRSCWIKQVSRILVTLPCPNAIANVEVKRAPSLAVKPCIIGERSEVCTY